MEASASNEHLVAPVQAPKETLKASAENGLIWLRISDLAKNRDLDSGEKTRNSGEFTRYSGEKRRGPILHHSVTPGHAPESAVVGIVR